MLLRSLFYPAQCAVVPAWVGRLIKLMRQGKLSAVHKGLPWAWKASDTEAKELMMKEAVATGFYDLVELLVGRQSAQSVLDQGLCVAIHGGRLEIAKLLLQHGARMSTVSIGSALFTKCADVIDFAADAGADLTTDEPFIDWLRWEWEVTFAAYGRLRPKFPVLQGQIDLALHYAVLDSNAERVRLLLSAGANPRARLPETADVWCRSPLETAIRRGAGEIVALFSIDPSIDDVNELFALAAKYAAEWSIELLLRVGADPNRPSGDDGPSPLGTLLESAGVRGSQYWVRAAETIVRAGGKLSFGERSRMLWVRRALCEESPERTVRFLELLRRKKAVDADTFRRLFDSASLRRHFWQQAAKLARLGVMISTERPARLGRRSRRRR